MNNIPKHLHLYWCGRNRMSWLQTLTPITFHDQNPDWKITVYKPLQEYQVDIQEKEYILRYKGEDCFSLVEALDYVEIKQIDLTEFDIDLKLHDILRSDILRYQVLHDIGGVWADFDVLWLKPMNELVNVPYYGNCSIEDAEIVLSYRHWKKGGHSIGVMIHAPENKFLKTVLEQTKRKVNVIHHEVYGVGILNKLFPNLEYVMKLFRNVVGVPYKTYYMFSCITENKCAKVYDTKDLFINNVPLDFIEDSEVICLHWFNGSGGVKNWLNRGIASNCTMMNLLKKIGKV